MSIGKISSGPDLRERQESKKNPSKQTTPDEVDCPPVLKEISPAVAQERISHFFGASKNVRRGPAVCCPVCNAAMVVRKRRLDGRMFLGCSSFPGCSGTYDIPESAQVEAKNWEQTPLTTGIGKACLPSKEANAMADAVADKAYTAASRPYDPEVTGDWGVYGRDASRSARDLGPSHMLEDEISRIMDEKIPVKFQPVFGMAEAFHVYEITVERITSGDPVISAGDRVIYNGHFLLFKGKAYRNPYFKGCWSCGWISHIRSASVEDLAPYMKSLTRLRAQEPNDKIKEDSMHSPEKNMDNGDKSDSSDSAKPMTVKARLARSAKKAPYRMARMRALTNGKRQLLKQLKKYMNPGTFDLVQGFLNTDAGEASIIGLIGLTGPMTPKIGKNKHVQAMCEEFLDEGVAKGFNQVLSLVGMIVEPAMKAALAEIPDISDIAAEAGLGRKKKRVATDSATRVAASEDEDDDVAEVEDIGPRRKSALRRLKPTG